MATVAVGHQPTHHWQSFASQHTLPSFQYGQPSITPQPYAAVEAPLRPRNDVDFTRERLILILDHFSQLLATSFNNRPLRLVVHGGACMLLHSGLNKLSQQQHQLSPTLPHRTTTRDVDYLHRSFVTEMAQLGVPYASAKLKECILATARHFNLGADWMNSDADIALPMANDPNTGMSYDPVYHASVQPNNLDLHTIYRSSNSMLTLISVTPFWAVSLKLVRYTLQDAADICLLLRNGTILSGTKWTHEMLREWLFANCWTMGYAQYDAKKLQDLNARLIHAIQMLSEWGTTSNSSPQRQISAHAAMGGGEVVGGEHGRQGWQSSFGTWPNAQQATAPTLTRPPPVQSVVGHTPPTRSNEPDWNTPAGLQPLKRNDIKEEIFIPPDIHDYGHLAEYEYGPPASHRNSRNSRIRDTTQAVQDSYRGSDSKARPLTPWHTQTDFTSMNDLQASLEKMLPYSQPSFPPAPAAGPVIPSIRRKKEKKMRDKARERDRKSKWLPRNSDDTDSTDGEDDDTYHRRASSSSWQIYAPPSTNPPQANPITRSYSYPQPYTSPPPVMPTPPKERHRPSPLDLSPTPRPVGLPPTHFIPAHAQIPQLGQLQPQQQHHQLQQQQQQQYHQQQYQHQQHILSTVMYQQGSHLPPVPPIPQLQPYAQQQQQQQNIRNNTLGLY